MTARTYDVILRVASAAAFTFGNVVTGASSNTVGTIAAVDKGNNLIKVKLANSVSDFIVGETIRSNSAVISSNANAYFDSTVMPYSSNRFSSNLTTATTTISSIAPSTFIAEKNAFTQNPIVRLYSLYFPGEWYPPNANGNPTGGQGAGRAWPNDFPIRFAEIIGDVSRDLNYNVSYGGMSYIPYPVNITGFDQSSDGKINEASITIYNVDNVISNLIENPYLVGNNSSNSIQALVNGEWVHGIDPRTVNATTAAWTTEFGAGDQRTVLLSRARSNGLNYSSDIVADYGMVNASFTIETTNQVNGTWNRQKLDSRDLLGGVLEVKTTFANFLDYWPEYSLVSAVPISNTFSVLNSLPYRIGDKVQRPSNWLPSTITSMATEYNTGISARRLSLGTYEGIQRGIAFSSDGANAYVVGDQRNMIVQYRLRNRWDISTAKYLQNSVYGATVAGIASIEFDEAGANIYVVGNITDEVRQFSLSSRWNIQTATSVASLPIGTVETTPRSVTFSKGGANVYVTGIDRDNVTQYSLSTPWNLSTASFVSNTSTRPYVFGAQEMRFNDTGTKLFIADNDRDGIYTFSLSTPWNTSTLAFESNTSFRSYTTAPFSISLGTGSNLYLLSYTNENLVVENNLYQFALSVPYTINTFYTPTSWLPPTSLALGNSMTVDRPFVRYLPLGTYETIQRGLAFSSDGANAYVVGSGRNLVEQYRLSTRWDITTAKYLQNSTTYGSTVVGLSGLEFDEAGANIYVVSDNADEVRQFSLSTRWNIQTATSVASLSTSVIEPQPRGVTFSKGGANVYVTGISRDNVTEYSLSTPWNLSTASFVSNTSVYTGMTAPQEIRFNSDGTKLFIADGDRDGIYTFSLSTPWDTSTMTFESNTSLRQYTTAPFSISLGTGSNLYVLSYTDENLVVSNNLYQFALSVPYTINSIYSAGSVWAPVDTPIYIVNDKADSDSYIEDKFKIDQLESLNDYVATFGLVSWLQYFKMVTPRRKYYKNTCQWVYKGTECQYPDSGTGSIAGTTYTANGYFTASNVPTVNATEDVCSKSYTACALRNNFLRFGGFPGVGRNMPRM